MSKQSKDNILNKIAAVGIRPGAAIRVDDYKNEEIYKSVTTSLLDCFVSELEAVNGVCVVCKNNESLQIAVKSFMHERNLNSVYCREANLKALLMECNVDCVDSVEGFEGMAVGATGCEFLIARTGSVMVSSKGQSGRQMIVFPPVHLVFASSNQLVSFPQDALLALNEKYRDDLPSVITTITGPSRTADIEKTLVLGAHGPKELIVFLSLV